MNALLRRWTMRVGLDPRPHALDVVHVDGDEVRGYVTLDCRTDHGHEPDHRVHEVAFRGSGSSSHLAFHVVVGAILPRRYRFEVFLVDGELAGVVDVGWDREGAVTTRLGVRARPAAAP